MRLTLPIWFLHARFLIQLWLVLVLVLPGVIYAGDDQMEAGDPTPTQSCNPVASGSSVEGSDSSVTYVQGVTCEQFSAEPTEAVQNEVGTEIAEGTLSAITLKELLLGRNYVFFGRAELDYAVYSGDIPSSDSGGKLRRLRLGITGLSPWFDQLSYKAEFDLTDGTNKFSDLYIQFDSEEYGSLRVGNQKVSQNLSAMTSSLSLLFMERPLPVSTFSRARRLAVSYDLNRGRWALHGMYFSIDPSNNAGKSGWAARFITQPIRGLKHIGHVGFSLVHEKIDREARYRTRPESNVTDLRLVDTGSFNDVKYQNTVGFELAGGRNTYSTRLELFRSDWERDAGRSNHFYGAYWEAGHFLTGQNFNYKNGKFVRPILEPGFRAWEIGLRVSWVDLNSRDANGGEQLNFGAALNYYRPPDLRFMVNLLRFKIDSVAGGDQGWILQARVQYNR
jgi:phosphate-selective porin OprO/OprP